MRVYSIHAYAIILFQCWEENHHNFFTQTQDMTSHNLQVVVWAARWIAWFCGIRSGGAWHVESHQHRVTRAAMDSSVFSHADFVCILNICQRVYLRHDCRAILESVFECIWFIMQIDWWDRGHYVCIFTGRGLFFFWQLRQDLSSLCNVAGLKIIRGKS